MEMRYIPIVILIACCCSLAGCKSLRKRRFAQQQPQATGQYSGNIDLISLLLQGQSQAQSQNASVGGTTYSLQNPSPVPVYQPYYANYQQGMSPYQKLLQYWVMMNRMYIPGMQINNDPRFPGGGVVTAGDGRDGTVVNRYGMRATVDGTDISWDGGW
ncbi:uncharacterized protein LOC124131975 [Haliotis rufescens]|uniref:uncharacterized protein LOC124131975 n=1 Tax=Haliotis rufescens TaxID=6454 RepID=UPI001EB07678|nr:uncharacterized protein LOC124131975 [Haliotis rufescens]XP_046351484.1 uncharacterized protein LOC124131975 [Haliotis rufescens]